MKKTILLGSVAFFMLSCSSSVEDTITIDNTDPSQQAVILPVKLSINGKTMKVNYVGTKITSFTSISTPGDKLIFEYNGDLISAIKFYEDNILQTVQEYTYNSNQVLSTSVDKEYEDDGVTVLASVTDTYTYVNANSIKVKRVVLGAETQPVMNLTYTYNNGNLVSSTGSGSLTSNGVTTNHTRTVTYTYTDKNYPFKNIKGFDKLIHADGSDTLFSNIKNSISSYTIKTSSTHSSGGVGSSFSSYKCTSTFNSNGYPISETRNSLD